MMVYKIILGRKNSEELIFVSISKQAIFPTKETLEKYSDAIMVISTCDASSLNDEEVKIFKSGLADLKKVA